MNLVRTDEQLIAFTGINFIILDSLEKAVNLCVKKYYANKFLNTARDRIVLCLCKLRLNMSFQCLSVLFGLSRHSCAHNFYYMVKLLSKILKPAIY